MAFHVDYWNYLGWKDPFSDSRYSNRQRRYAQVTHSGRIYTPQMIVNGTQAFVGSDRRRGTSAINSALKQSRSHDGVNVILKPRAKLDSGKVVVEFKVSKAPGQSVLHVTLVEREITQHIRSGENSGRTLKHENVVRAFETIEFSKAVNGQVELSVPSSVVIKNASIIGYVQNPKTMLIIGATGIDL